MCIIIIQLRKLKLFLMLKLFSYYLLLQRHIKKGGVSNTNPLSPNYN